MSWVNSIILAFQENEQKNQEIMSRIPEKYHCYLQWLANSRKISNSAKQEISSSLKKAGVYACDGKLFQKLETVYMRVPGRLAMFFDFVQEHGYRYKIGAPEYTELKGTVVCSRTVTVYDKNGNIVMEATDCASVKFGGKAVNRTHPVENAATSALGRALGALGFGTEVGIATAEEVLEARSQVQQEEENLEYLQFVKILNEHQDFVVVQAVSQDGEMFRFAANGSEASILKEMAPESSFKAALKERQLKNGTIKIAERVVAT
jgi:hypothetical protein